MLNIPIQMYSCTDTDGKITPLKFKFQEKTGCIRTYQIVRILKAQHMSVGNTYDVLISDYDRTKKVSVCINFSDQKWFMQIS